MAKLPLLSVSLNLLLLFHGCLARSSNFEQFQNECQINKLESIEPVTRVKSEAGFTEWWNPNSQQLMCAAVAVLRETVEPQGLVLPSFSNTNQLVHIIKGSGVLGMILPGCPATFQDSQHQGRRQDQHQKIQRFREGDVIVLPAGVPHWFYNDANQPFVTVAFLHLGNSVNQLDRNPRKFHLAGNPEEEQKKLQRLQQQKQGITESEQEEEEEKHKQCTNSLCFNPEYLAQAFNVDEDVIRKIQEQGKSGTIIRVKNLQFIEPPRVQHEEGRRGSMGGDNGVYCAMKMKENIAEPELADIFNPQAGRITTLNSFKLPLLSHLGMSAERGVLFNKGGLVPQWSDAHRIFYMVKGRARFQVVNQNGESVFDDYVEQGQLLTVPQNFAFMKRAGNEGAEWVSFYTNDNAKNTPMAGVGSYMQGVPEEVVAAAYQISREEAREVKFNNQNNFFFTSSSRPQPRAEEA
ncbi:11-S seed storage protein, plant [Corchorus capsularis]|uniref:11-S seed storage protein, plant n=1 Tax=Corchorus capsularis TaxID=210143 RepID=A0A1R3K7Q6_COCAP|nr:11-S seed storage protein, plant [Corchorus capsularis]